MKSLRFFGALAGIALLGAALSTPATPAWAAAGVSVTSDRGAGVVDAEYATSVTVAGSGFQTIRNGFGGVYVLFGWVDDPGGGSWKPSNGGQVGTNFRYVPDSEAKDNAGFQRFVAFPGGSTEDSAQGVLGDDGTFTVTMTIPGARFEALDRSGNVTTVDCTTSTCGIITIGAHGVKNATNETFTALTFTSGEQPAAAAPAPSAMTTAAAAATKDVRVGLAKSAVAAGSNVVFTAQGFTPGEQVVADFDQGISAVGPLIAGSAGEVAGALTVPSDVRNGTHLVSVRGASSGAVAEAEVTVTGGTAALIATPSDPGIPPWVWATVLGATAFALILVLTSIIVSITRAAKKRKARKDAAPLPVYRGGDDAPTMPITPLTEVAR